MKPRPTDYVVTFWLENFGYSSTRVHATSALEAGASYLHAIRAKYGPSDLIITSIKPVDSEPKVERPQSNPWTEPKDPLDTDRKTGQG